MVLDQTKEYKDNGTVRELGIVVIKGSTVNTICAEEGYEEISNPYLDEE